jgi:hypothetical protein
VGRLVQVTIVFDSYITFGGIPGSWFDYAGFLELRSADLKLFDDQDKYATFTAESATTAIMSDLK